MEKGKSVSPYGLAFLGVGTFMQAKGKYDALMAQGEAEAANAGFYATQADFAQAAGDRQKRIYERESQVLYGEQLSGFAKAGIDSENSSFFMASQMLLRQEGSSAITAETEMNVRLAHAREFASMKAENEYAYAAGNEKNSSYLQTAATVAMFL